MISEEALADRDKLCLRFADSFEKRFIAQGDYEDRSIEQTLDLGWDLLSVFPRGKLKCCDPKTVEAARKANRYKYMSQSATA